MQMRRSTTDPVVWQIIMVKRAPWPTVKGLSLSALLCKRALFYFTKVK